MSTCYIAAALDSDLRFERREGDMIIAADKGLERLLGEGIEPDVILGDFDSLGYIPHGEKVLRYPREKDDTDLMLAVKLGLSRGYADFVVSGALGGRFDHSIASVQALAYLTGQGAKGLLAGMGERATMLDSGRLRFSGGERGIVSVFAYGGDACGVCLSGLKYPLDNARLTADNPLGVSNEFTGSPAEISVRLGRLLVVWSSSSDR